MADHRPLLCARCTAPLSVKEKPHGVCDRCRAIAGAVERLIASARC